MDYTNFCERYIIITNNNDDKIKKDDIKQKYIIHYTDTIGLDKFYNYLINDCKIIEKKNIFYGIQLSDFQLEYNEEIELLCNSTYILNPSTIKLTKTDIKKVLNYNGDYKIILSYMIANLNVKFSDKKYYNIQIKNNKVEKKIEQEKNINKINNIDHYNHFEEFCNNCLEFTDNNSDRVKPNELKNIYIKFNNNKSVGINLLIDHLDKYKGRKKKGGDREYYKIIIIKNDKITLASNPIKTLSTSKKCIVKGCNNTQPVYNVPEKPIGDYCIDCKTIDMINVVNKKCKYDGCKTQPCFNLPGEQPEFCSKHADKKNGMINVKDLLCKCGKYASFNKPGLKPEFCKTCSEDGMYNIKANRCRGINCNTIPSYNYSGQYARYCEKCADKDNGMINVISKRCKYEGCYTLPTYGIKGEAAEYCQSHSLEDMVDVYHKMCFTCGKSRASFNDDGLKPMFCNTCKGEDMINLTNDYKKCVDCKDTLATFNYEGELPKYCKSCSLNYKNMVDVCHDMCIKCNLKRPSFNYEGLKPKYCGDCADKKNMEIIYNHKSCIICNMTRANPKYKDHCFNCYCFKYPLDPIVRNHKTKENQIVSDLIKKYPNIIHDKQIKGGCSKKRPDILIQLNDYNIIVEIDENQHNNYSCENKRIMEIFSDLGNSPMVIIRFNPDKYKNKNNNTIKSIFQLSEGKLKLVKTTYYKRLEILINTINYYINNRPNEELKIKTLFYDEI
jgi:hypothetical protein